MARPKRLLTSCHRCCKRSSTAIADLPGRASRRERGDIMAIARQTTGELAQPSESDAAVCVRIDRAMRMLDIGKTKLYELIGTGELETIHIGRRTLVSRARIEAFVERLRKSSF
jgi:excisionase family DNA binding protein